MLLPVQQKTKTVSGNTMRPYIFLILLLFSLPHLSSGQSSVDTCRILTQIIRPQSDTATFLYTDRVDTFFLNKVKQAVTRSSICGPEFIRYNTFRRRCIRLTRQERDYILLETEKYTQPYWKENMYPDSKLISLDTFYKMRERADTVSLKGIKHKEPMFKVHQFTNPIFIKAGKYFLMLKVTFWMSDKSFQILAISHDLSVYRKDKGVWKEYFVIDGGIMDF